MVCSQYEFVWQCWNIFSRSWRDANFLWMITEKVHNSWSRCVHAVWKSKHIWLKKSNILICGVFYRPNILTCVCVLFCPVTKHSHTFLCTFLSCYQTGQCTIFTTDYSQQIRFALCDQCIGLKICLISNIVVHPRQSHFHFALPATSDLSSWWAASPPCTPWQRRAPANPSAPAVETTGWCHGWKGTSDTAFTRTVPVRSATSLPRDNASWRPRWLSRGSKQQKTPLP